MHLTDDELALAIRQFAALLRPGGIVFLSASMNREELTRQRDPGGRLFVERTPKQVEALMQAGGLECLKLFLSRDTLKRPLRWFTQVYRKNA